MEENIIIGVNTNEFLLGTARSDLIVGEAGNDKIVARGDDDNLYGDFNETLEIFTDLSHLPMVITSKFGNDSIWGNKGDDEGTGDADGITFEIEDNAVDKTIPFKFGNDCFYGGKGNDSFIGDVSRININFEPESESNKVILHYGNDYIDLGDNHYGLQWAVGDVESLSTDFRSNNNTQKHYFGDDHIKIAATIIPPLSELELINDLAATKMVNDIELRFNIEITSGDIVDAFTNISSEFGTDSHLVMGSDKIKIGTIKSEISIDKNGPTDPAFVENNATDNEVELDVNVGLALVTGDGAQASTFISEGIMLDTSILN